MKLGAVALVGIDVRANDEHGRLHTCDPAKAPVRRWVRGTERGVFAYTLGAGPDLLDPISDVVEILVGDIEHDEVHGACCEEELVRGIEHQLSSKIVPAHRSLLLGAANV